MGSKKYLVLGAGMGEAIAYRLAASFDTHLTVVGDIDVEKAIKVCRFVNKSYKPRCVPLLFDAEKMQNVTNIFKQFDVVISALPAKYNPELAEKAIRAGVHFCDLGGVLDVTNQIVELDRKYPDMKSSVVPDCGLMPGLGIIIAKKLMQDLGKTESVEILVGGLPQKPRPPVFYQCVFSPEGLKHLCYDSAPILKESEIKWVPPFYGYNQFDVSELIKFSERFRGRVEAFITAGTSIAPWSFQKWGVKNFSEKTVRWPGFVEFFKNVPSDQFEGVVASKVNIPVNVENPDLVWMRVAVSGEKDGFLKHKLVSFLDLFDLETGLTAMQRTTGFTTAVIAEMIAEGKTKPGINTPENAFNYSGVNEILKRVGKFFALKEN